MRAQKARGPNRARNHCAKGGQGSGVLQGRVECIQEVRPPKPSAGVVRRGKTHTVSPSPVCTRQYGAKVPVPCVPEMKCETSGGG